MDTNEKHTLYEAESIKCCDDILDVLNSTRFTQNINGYDCDEVDTFLDNLVELTNYHKSFQSLSVFIEPKAIIDYTFTESIGGYLVSEITEFLSKVAKMYDSLNAIKEKHMADTTE